MCFLVSDSTVNWSTGCKYVTQHYLLYIISATVDEVSRSMHDFQSKPPRTCMYAGLRPRFFTKER